jgi:TonB-linked SusC/RagA family outer membrane protein
VQEGGSTNGLAVQANTDFGNIQTEELLRYSHSFGSDHRLDFVGGYSFEYNRNTFTSSTVADFPNDLLGANNLASGSLDYPVNNQFLTWELRSWLGRANYTFLGRYIFTANIRNDCSSKFTTNNKCATFPAFAVAWRAVDEPFLKNQSVISDLKFRGSWGQQGNQAISPFQSQALIGPPQYQVPIGNTIVGAETPVQLASPNLKWETTTQWDVGLDAGAFDQRLTLTADYYSKRTVDLLQSLTLPDNTGFTSVFFNSGIVTNKGIELAAAFDIFRQQKFLFGDFSWNISGNASHNTNNVVSLGPIASELGVRLGPGYGATFQPFIFQPGLPLGTIWGLKTNGIFKTQAEVNAALPYQSNACIGCVRYVAIDPATGKPNAVGPSDYTNLGSVLPSWTYGMTNRFRWGKFDLSALVTIVRGNKIINIDRTQFFILNGQTNVPKSFVQKSFNPTTNPNGTYPEISINNGQYPYMSDLFVEDGGYLRLKNVQLGYTFNLPGARTARVYVNGINLLTSTNYSGYDPETAAVGNGIGPDVNHMPGVDQGTYPFQRIFAFGVNTTF